MIKANNVVKSFDNVAIINDFNLQINKGDFIAITGESGSGKTTVLNLLGLLEKPDFGEIIIEEKSKFSKKEVMLLQRNKFSYLFQNYALIENETVQNNLKISLEYQKGIDKKKKMLEAMQFVNLSSSFLNKKIYQLSGGEQQRIAVARLWLKESDYVFADEPTGNLDNKNRDIVFDLLKKLNEMGKAIIFVTHDLELAQKAQKIIKL